jgi:hypothetical protein
MAISPLSCEGSGRSYTLVRLAQQGAAVFKED